MANSNSFSSPYEFFPIAQGTKYLGKCSYFIIKLIGVELLYQPILSLNFVLCVLSEAILMSTFKKPLL